MKKVVAPWMILEEDLDLFLKDDLDLFSVNLWQWIFFNSFRLGTRSKKVLSEWISYNLITAILNIISNLQILRQKCNKIFFLISIIAKIYFFSFLVGFLLSHIFCYLFHKTIYVPICLTTNNKLTRPINLF